MQDKKINARIYRMLLPYVYMLSAISAHGLHSRPTRTQCSRARKRVDLARSEAQESKTQTSARVEAIVRIQKSQITPLHLASAACSSAFTSTVEQESTTLPTYSRLRGPDESERRRVVGSLAGPLRSRPRRRRRQTEGLQREPVQGSPRREMRRRSPPADARPPRC